MYPADFDYYRATTVEEAVSLLAEHDEAKLLAGGHSLIPMLKLRLAQPPALIDIGRIAELRGISAERGTVRVGALTTHTELADSRELKSACRILAEAARQIGDPQVRNKGTIGGNIAHADPASDLPAVLVAVEGVIHLVGSGGARRVPASDFFLGLLTTAIDAGEIVTHVEVPTLPAGSGCAYLKLEHPASGYAVCGAAAVVELGSRGLCTRVRLCLNGVSATPYWSEALHQALVGAAPEDGAIDDAVDEHLRPPQPLSDTFASSEYRSHIARVYAGRALRQARDRASSG